MLSQYGPDLLVQCESALKMSKELVTTWLRTWMFKDMDDGEMMAERISEWLADHQGFKSHSRHISRDEIRRNGLRTTWLETDEGLQDLALSVFHATTHTFSGSPAIKIVESHTGRAFIKQQAFQPAQPIQFGIAPPA